ncbi:hypothetical protein COY62_02475 [bacterium (Candidatus Howlettbacteria) CG_4_10_14_0_8_um_filter_40_9]|nr:MAG: hypothetical protein COY62_02475 [bacterium (Candidatus Howlettbacteria) CG_4_10_14_0_8_um_filter_40_9]
MHPESIDKKTKLVLEKIKSSVNAFYLAGGTALAIQLGHRKSIDLDFFSKDSFDLSPLEKTLVSLGKFEITGKDEGTLHGILDGVKISFMRYDYRSLFPFSDFDGVNLADKRDISAMKIDTISSRGSKKDFVDLYFLLYEFSIKELIGFYEKKYSEIDYNKIHIVKSLTYFEDADGEPLPEMIKDFDWEKAKEKITNAVKTII